MGSEDIGARDDQELERARHAVETELISEQQLAECLVIQATIRRLGLKEKPLSEILIEKGYLRRRDWLRLQVEERVPGQDPGIFSNRNVELQKLPAEPDDLEKYLSGVESDKKDLGRTPASEESLVIMECVEPDETSAGEETEDTSAQSQEDPDSIPVPEILQSATPQKEEFSIPGETGIDIPGYKIQGPRSHRLGETVCRGIQLSMHRPVSIHILDENLAANEEYVERFLSQTRIIARLNHENLVSLIDAGKTPEGIPYYISEFAEGERLDKIVKREGALPVSQALGIILQITRALDHAHQHGLTHRGVKPGSIIVNKEVARLCDLGLMTVEESTPEIPEESTPETPGKSTPGTSEESTPETSEESTPETPEESTPETPEESTPETPGEDTTRREKQETPLPRYSSPELERREKSIDIRSDIYSLGACCYYLLTGSPPSSQVDPRTQNPEVPEAVWTILRKCTKTNRRQRYQKPAQLAVDLEACLLEIWKASRQKEAREIPESIPAGADEVPPPPPPAPISPAPPLVVVTVARENKVLLLVLGIFGAMLALGSLSYLLYPVLESRFRTRTFENGSEELPLEVARARRDLKKVIQIPSHLGNKQNYLQKLKTYEDLLRRYSHPMAVAEIERERELFLQKLEKAARNSYERFVQKTEEELERYEITDDPLCLKKACEIWNSWPFPEFPTIQPLIVEQRKDLEAQIESRLEKDLQEAISLREAGHYRKADRLCSKSLEYALPVHAAHIAETRARNRWMEVLYHFRARRFIRAKRTLRDLKKQFGQTSLLREKAESLNSLRREIEDGYLERDAVLLYFHGRFRTVPTEKNGFVFSIYYSLDDPEQKCDFLTYERGCVGKIGAGGWQIEFAENGLFEVYWKVPLNTFDTMRVAIEIPGESPANVGVSLFKQGLPEGGKLDRYLYLLYYDPLRMLRSEMQNKIGKVGKIPSVPVSDSPTAALCLTVGNIRDLADTLSGMVREQVEHPDRKNWLLSANATDGEKVRFDFVTARCDRFQGGYFGLYANSRVCFSEFSISGTMDPETIEKISQEVRTDSQNYLKAEPYWTDE